MKTPPTYVPSKGLIDADFIVVGEQPGQKEVRYREPFIGPAGHVLDDTLHLAGIARRECYFTNVIKDLEFPIKHYIDLSKKDAYVSPEANQYLKQLEEEISHVPANVIIAVGNIALWALTGRKGITNWRGSVLESTMIPGRKVIPIIHPATVIPPKSQYLNKFLITHDLLRCQKERESKEVSLIKRFCLIEPTYQECLDFLDLCYQKGLEGAVIDLDIEVIREEMTCISLAYDEVSAISVPFESYDGPYFDIDQEAIIMRRIAKIIEDPDIALAGQNFLFDIDFLLLKFHIVPRGPLYCTMIAQKMLMPDFKVGLDFITSMHTDIPYYKADGKKWMKVGGAYRTFWHYNAMDSIATAAARESQLTIIHKQGNSETLSRKIKSMYPYLDMMQRGILVDQEGFKQEYKRTEESIAEAEDRLYTAAGYEFNYNSSAQVMHHLHDVLNLKPFKKRTQSGWVPTSDEDAMKRHARNGIVEAKIILELRRLIKRKGTYLNTKSIRANGRITTQYKPHGTSTGRPSSSIPIIWPGVNLFNWPHDLMTYLIPDPGYWYLSFDLSQAENRIVAYVGRIPSMIEAFETGKDVHKLTAGLVFGIPPDEVSSAPGSTNLGDGQHSQRDWGKKSNHSLNYDLGYRNFALRFEILEKEAKWIVEQYHKVYPEVRSNYHAMVQAQLKQNRVLTNLFDRKRRFMDKWGGQLFKDAYAHIPQSTVADKIDEHGLNFVYYNQELFKPVELLNMVYDSIGFQIPINTPWKRQAKIVQTIKDKLETPLRWGGTEFVVPADLSLGLTLNKSDGAEIKHSQWPTSLDALADELRETYTALSQKEINYA